MVLLADQDGKINKFKQRLKDLGQVVSPVFGYSGLLKANCDVVYLTETVNLARGSDDR